MNVPQARRLIGTLGTPSQRFSDDEEEKKVDDEMKLKMKEFELKVMELKEKREKRKSDEFQSIINKN